MEGDVSNKSLIPRKPNFYPRPPGGGRQWVQPVALGLGYFYPRPPGGGRPCTSCPTWRSCCNFYPRPPGGGRHERCHRKSLGMAFLSTPSGWRATAARAALAEARVISIHALRVEGDSGRARRRSRGLYFYPRPPGGGRLCKTIQPWHEFQISIHALRVEGDHRTLCWLAILSIFLSTPSGWRATAALLLACASC